MAKNYAKEARLSRIRVESIVSRAKTVSLLYLLAIILLVGMALGFVLQTLEVVSLEPLILVGVSAAAAVVGVIIGGISISKRVGKNTRLERDLKKLKDSKKDVKAKIKEIKKEIKLFKKAKKACRKEKNKTGENGYAKLIRNRNEGIRVGERFLKQIAGKKKEIKRYYRTNRQVRNLHTESKYKTSKRIMEGMERGFVVVCGLVFSVFFAFMAFRSTELSTEESIFDMVGFKDGSPYTIVLITLLVGSFFHFICALLSGKVTKVRMNVGEDAMLHTLGVAEIDDGDISIQPYDGMFEGNPLWAGVASFPRRDDEQEAALLEERPREYGITIFFFRNLFQVVFGFVLAWLMVYLYPAFNEIGKVSEATPFHLILTIVQYILTILTIYLIVHAMSAQEYDYDCMDEALQRKRVRYRVFLVLYLLLSAAYLVVMLIGGIPDVWSTEVFNDEIKLRIFVSLGSMVLLSLGAFVADIIIRPKDPINKEDDFFALTRGWRNIPLDD